MLFDLAVIRTCAKLGKLLKNVHDLTVAAVCCAMQTKALNKAQLSSIVTTHQTENIVQVTSHEQPQLTCLHNIIGLTYTHLVIPFTTINNTNTNNSP